MTVRAHCQVTTFDVTSNTVMTSATVNVYTPGTVTPISATIYDRLGNPLSNPLTSDATTGLCDFYLLVAQEVDLVVSKSAFTTRTYSNVPVLDDSSLELTALLTTTGDIVYASSANTPVRLPIGTNNYVMNVTGGVPKWTSALQVSDANNTICVGGSASTNMGINVLTTLSTNVNQYGVSIGSTCSAAATSSGVGLNVTLTTAASSFVMTSGYGVLVNGPSLGASSSITTNYGVQISNQGASGITNAYGVYITAVSGASSVNVGLHNGGTTELAGGVFLLAATPTAAASQIGIGQTTTASATAGSNGDVPAQVAGYWSINIGGTVQKVPYYNA